MTRKAGRPRAEEKVTWVRKSNRINPATSILEPYGSYTRILGGRRAVLVSCFESERESRLSDALATLETKLDLLADSPTAYRKGVRLIRDELPAYLESLGTRSPGHQANASNVLRKWFLPFVGASPCNQIDGEFVQKYHRWLRQQIKTGKLSAKRANTAFDHFTYFVSYLVTFELLAGKPRPLATRVARKNLIFKVEQTRIEPLTLEQFGKLYRAASPRLRAYMLLSANTSLTQADLGELTHDMIDWDRGTLTKKRKKTRDTKAPTVTWKLWRETLEALRDEGDSGTDYVFLNAAGNVVQVKVYDEETGKQLSRDSIGRQFASLARRLGLDVTFSQLRKLSAQLIHDKPEFHYLHTHMLAHAPHTIAGQFYVQPKQAEFDRAIEWLHSQYAPHL